MFTMAGVYHWFGGFGSDLIREVSNYTLSLVTLLTRKCHSLAFWFYYQSLTSPPVLCVGGGGGGSSLHFWSYIAPIHSIVASVEEIQGFGSQIEHLRASFCHGNGGCFGAQSHFRILVKSDENCTYFQSYWNGILRACTISSQRS